MTSSTLASPLADLATTGIDLVVLGATGDLAQRKLLPALAAAQARGLIAESTRVIGLGGQQLNTHDFRKLAETALSQHSSGSDAEARGELLAKLSYVTLDLLDRAGWVAVANELPAGTGRTRVFYLACAPDIFGPVCGHLAAVGLADSRSRVVLEKPIGTDLASARRISDQVEGVFGERQVFRIDHYLGKESVQNLLVLRFGNSVFAPLWNAKAIDHVQITVSESLGVGTRAGYYDTSGALRDMVQNHLLQLLCLVAMEPPHSLDADSIRDAKVNVLNALKPWTAQHAAAASVRGQYDGYLLESGNPGSETETFVALRADIQNWRWAGVPFYLRSGKRLARHASEIVIQLKDVPHWIFPTDATHPSPNQLVIGLHPNEVVHLDLRSKVPGPGPVRLASKPLRLDLASAFPAPSASAHERLLLDVLQDNPVLFMRRDEVEAAWAWIDPLLAAWRDGATPLLSYAPGGNGPSAAVELLARDGRRWYGDDAR